MLPSELHPAPGWVDPGKSGFDLLNMCRPLSYGLDNPQAERALATFQPNVPGVLLPAQHGTLIAFSTSGRQAEELLAAFREHAGI